MNDVFIVITNKCNNNCYYCLNKNILNTNEDISFDSFKSLINRLRTQSIVFYGGEPTLHKDIFKFLEYCILNNKKVTIPTNGNFDDISNTLLKYHGINNPKIRFLFNVSDYKNIKYKKLFIENLNKFNNKYVITGSYVLDYTKNINNIIIDINELLDNLEKPIMLSLSPLMSSPYNQNQSIDLIKNTKVKEYNSILYDYYKKNSKIKNIDISRHELLCNCSVEGLENYKNIECGKSVKVDEKYLYFCYLCDYKIDHQKYKYIDDCYPILIKEIKKSYSKYELYPSCLKCDFSEKCTFKYCNRIKEVIEYV
jgi:MoaA/NifB/PqqE/SkfB family radical SAM enzyme